MTYEIFFTERIAFIFLILTGTLYLISRTADSRAPRRHSTEKYKIYTGGEDYSPAKFNIPETGFLRIIVKYMKLEKLSATHSGNLSRYLSWMLMGIVFLILTLVILWQ